MVITAEQVKQLRDKTGAGMMDCKSALTEATGDIEKAIEILRKKGLASAAKRAGRATKDGMIGHYIHMGGKVAVLVEVNCETDFVARTEDFQRLAKELAMHIAAADPKFVRREDVPAEVLEKEKEIYRAQFADSGKPANVIDKIAEERRGLILVTGATGSGKSTTLAAMIDTINATRSGHIVTIEDPIEFLHRDKKSFVTQREVDVDTRSFADALRGALRQDPDVILVGEMRDHETIETALTAAETGHLVLSTLHTLDATETITRIVSSFPSHQQKTVRIQLAGILKAVVSMRLVRAAKGAGRVPAIEVLVSTGFIRDHIINEEKTYMIREAIAAGTSQYGMQTFDQSLFHLLQSRLITQEEALHNATNPDEFKMRISGIYSKDDGISSHMTTPAITPPPPASKESESIFVKH